LQQLSLSAAADEPAAPQEPARSHAEADQRSNGAHEAILPTPPNAGPSYDFAPGELCPFCSITPEWPHGETGLHWHHHWKRVGLQEYLTVPLLAASALALNVGVRAERDADWNSPILFDSAVRNALRLNSSGARATARNISDGLFVISYVHPIVIDNFIVTWGIRQSPQVAWQMFMINAQAYALTFALTDATKRFTSRARPWVDPCDQDPTGKSCGSGGRYSSFFSGHASVTATGAGLICAHHTQLSLYRNPYLDTGACVVAVLGTAVTGALRVASDNHWASDVVVGHLTGYVSGYLLPTLFYYKEFRITPRDDHPPGEPTPPSFAVLPLIAPGSAQLTVFGQL
jgi:membrane-associated phospholipid phosphatase